MTTIDENTDPLTAVVISICGGKFRIQVDSDDGPGRRYGRVLDDAGREIGGANDYCYGGRGWAVHTAPYAGFVPEAQIEYVPKLKQQELWKDEA